MEVIKPKTIKENLLLNIVRLLLNVLFPIVIFQHVSRILGPVILGQVEYANAIAYYFIFFSSLGIPAYGFREIARHRNDPQKRTKTIFELSIIMLIATGINYAVYFFLIYFVSGLRAHYLLYLIIAPNILLTTFNYEWFFSGIEEQRYITVRHCIVRALQLILVFVCIKESTDYIKYVGITIGLNSIASIFNVLYMRKFLIKVKKSDLEIKRHLRLVFIIFIGSLSSAILGQLDITMLGNISGIPFVGFYFAANKVKNAVFSLFGAVINVTIPRAEYYKINNEIKYKNIVKFVINSVLIFIIPISIGVFIYAEDIIYFLSGKEFQLSILALRLLSFSLFIDIISSILLSLFLFPNRNEKEFSISLIAAGSCKVILNLILLPSYAHIGVSISTIISGVICVVLQAYFARKYFKFSFLFNNETIKYFIAGIVMACVLAALPIKFESNSLNILAGLFAGMFAYSLVLFLIKSELFYIFIKKIKSLKLFAGK